MKIAVCVTQVPDTASKINLADDNKSINPDGISFVFNPYDEYAVEEAIKTKEQSGGEICVISLGPEKNKETIRKALAMGCDSAVLLKTEEYFDSLAIAKALAEEIKNQESEIVFLGKQAVDYDNSIIGQLVAAILDYNCVSVTVKLDINDGTVTAEREIEGGKEILKTSLPVVITAQKGLNEPRYASLKGIMASKKIQIEEKIPLKTDNKVEIIGMKKPESKGTGKILGFDAGAVVELVRLLKEEAKVI